MIDIISVIKQEFPEKAIELSESLQLLKESINLTIDDISIKAGEAFVNRDFDSIDKYKELLEQGTKYEKKIEEYIDLLELEDDAVIIDVDDISYANQQRETPNYADYLVDNQVEHSLFEDWKYKRPFGFKFIKNEFIEAKLWYEVFIKTCEILYNIDSNKFNNFEYLPHMNGKKKKYFSANPNDLRKPFKIKDGVSIEINHSANTFRNIIVKMLKEYKFKLSDYKVYFHADYTELNKKDR